MFVPGGAYGRHRQRGWRDRRGIPGGRRIRAPVQTTATNLHKIKWSLMNSSKETGRSVHRNEVIDKIGKQTNRKSDKKIDGQKDCWTNREKVIKGQNCKCKGWAKIFKKFN